MMNTCMCDAFDRGLCLCLCVCPHDSLKIIAGICFLVVNYVDLRKILNKFTCQGHSSRSFLEGSRSLRTVTSCSVAATKIPYLTGSFSSFGTVSNFLNFFSISSIYPVI